MIYIRNIQNNGMKQRHGQKGISLVELLVSMTLGAFLLTGVVTNFSGTKKINKTRAAVTEMDANSRIAIDVLRQTILNAGYQSINNVRLETAFYTPRDGVLTNPVCSDGNPRDILTPTANEATRDFGKKDHLTVVSLADNPCRPGFATCPLGASVNPSAHVYYDCVGGGAKRDTTRVVSCSTDKNAGMGDPTEAKIYSSFWLDNNKTMYCQGSRGGAQPLVDNIESLQFLYGVQKGDDEISYRDATQVNNDDQWGLVRSVQVGLLLRSPTKILSQPSNTTSYILLDENITISSSDLKYLFRVYTTTINLENRNKGALL